MPITGHSIGDNYAAHIKAQTMNNPANWGRHHAVTELARRIGATKQAHVFNLFNTGHALPLLGRRFWRYPRCDAIAALDANKPKRIGATCDANLAAKSMRRNLLQLPQPARRIMLLLL